LDVVQGVTSHQQPVPADFTFNETLTGRHDDALEASMPDLDTMPTFSTPSSQASPLEAKPVFSHKDSTSTTSSRAPSVAPSTHSSTYSFSPRSTQISSIKTELQEASPTTKRRPSRPTFCPLPPRLDMMPVVPIPMDMSDGDFLGSFDEYQQPAFPLMSDWQMINNSNSNNNDMGLNTSLMPPLYGMDHSAYSNQNATPEAWNSWVDEHVEYVSLDALVWSRFLWN